MNHEPSASDLLACAVAAAQAAGDHALRNESRRHEVAERLRHDVKLNLDFECQRKAEEVIRGAFPSHGILGEEGGSRAAREAVWLVDPIDGTVNFSHGVRMWCSSVAVEVGGEMVAGAVYAPSMGEIFAAVRGQPSTLNGTPIRVSDVADLEHALVLTGIEKPVDPGRHTMDRMHRISMAVQKVRILGAAALDLCHVACGRADAFFEAGIFIWDIAAGGLLVEQAGGRVDRSQAEGSNRVRCLATNGRIHDGMRPLVEDPRAV
jgi:myo-inositol-1(or 4)-monophosphatase